MDKIGLEEMASDPIETKSERWRISDRLGLEAFACNYYRIAPGERSPGGLHAHMDQEELFLVLTGEATFETLQGERTVENGEAIRFAPGEFQCLKNDSDSDLFVLAVGAPPNTEDIRVPAECPDCGFEGLCLEFEVAISFVCPDCEREHAPADCPECGHGDLQMRSDEKSRAVAVCKACSASFDRPPLED